MRKIKPLLVSVLTIVLFVGILLVGMTTEWWQTEGRKTPLDYVKNSGADSEYEAHEEEDRESNSISGESTVQDAIDLGISLEELEYTLDGPVEDMTVKIKDLSNARNLKFGIVKDMLNTLIK